MNRLNFLISLGAITLAPAVMNTREILSALKNGNPSPKMPVLFLGHGSPMNAIEENDFVRGFHMQAALLPKPAAILCVSAHWETRGTFVTAMEHPRTIHDFGGFPQVLFDVQYPAPGSTWLADETVKSINSTEVSLDQQWGLDHGAWSVIKHLYPNADIPIVQMSIDYTKPAAYHYQLAKELAALRTKGVLIIGSGNMVHNLRMVAWDKMNAPNYAYDWAQEASSIMKGAILSGNHTPLINHTSGGSAMNLAIPTPEHFLPLLYVLALQEKNEEPILFNDQAVAGSLTMTSVKIA